MSTVQLTRHIAHKRIILNVKLVLIFLELKSDIHPSMYLVDFDAIVFVSFCFAVLEVVFVFVLFCIYIFLYCVLYVLCYAVCACITAMYFCKHVV